LDSERRQLGDSQAKAGLRDHYCPYSVVALPEPSRHPRHKQPDIRSRSERGMLGRIMGLDATSRSWTAAAKMDPQMRQRKPRSAR
jgi:hypothetical protein